MIGPFGASLPIAVVLLTVLMRSNVQRALAHGSGIVNQGSFEAHGVCLSENGMECANELSFDLQSSALLSE